MKKVNGNLPAGEVFNLAKELFRTFPIVIDPPMVVVMMGGPGAGKGWMETYSRIGLLRSYRKLTVVLDYYEAMETYSRIGLLRSC